MAKTTLDIRGEDTGATVEMNLRDLRFMLNMVVATCNGNFQPDAMKEWTLKVLGQLPK
jgi:hypothetical protein